VVIVPDVPCGNWRREINRTIRPAGTPRKEGWGKRARFDGCCRMERGRRMPLDWLTARRRRDR
jgi:hypothetical protein